MALITRNRQITECCETLSSIATDSSNFPCVVCLGHWHQCVVYISEPYQKRKAKKSGCTLPFNTSLFASDYLLEITFSLIVWRSNHPLNSFMFWQSLCLKINKLCSEHKQKSRQQTEQSGFSFKQEKTSVSLVRIKPWLELLWNICTLQKPSKAYWKKMLGLKISSKRDQKMSWSPCYKGWQYTTLMLDFNIMLCYAMQ